MGQFAKIKVQRPQAQQKTSTLLPSRSNRLQSPHSSSLHRSLHDNGGQPLDAGTRTLMEARFGHNFSHVRVHTDAPAASAASRWNARAITQDHHVHFGDRYEPASPAGKALLAHELTHVVQADAAASTPAQPANSVDALEREARHVGSAFRLGAALPPIRGLARGLPVPLRAGPEDDPGVPTFGNLPGDQPLSGFRLKLQEIDGKWYEILPGREKNRRRAAGWYDFVVQDGEIWAEKARSPYGHTEAARGKRVEFAGQVRFTSHSGQITEWNQGSGHYRPTKFFAAQVGLPINKFRSHPDPLQSVQLPVFQPQERSRPSPSAPSKTPGTVAGEINMPQRGSVTPHGGTPRPVTSASGVVTLPQRGSVTTTGGTPRSATSASGEINVPQRGSVTPPGETPRPVTSASGEINVPHVTLPRATPQSADVAAELSRAAARAPSGAAGSSPQVEIGSRGAIAGAAADVLIDLVVVPMVNRLLEKQNAGLKAEWDRQLTDQAIAEARPEFLKVIESNQEKVQGSHTQGRPVYLHVVIETRYQESTESNPFLGVSVSSGYWPTAAKVVNIQIVYEGEQPKPYAPDRNWFGDIIRDLLGTRFVSSNLQIPL